MTTRRGSFGTRLVEWFWRGATLTEQRRTLPELGDRATVFAERAKSSAELAHSALTPDEPRETSAEASASELYRQSAYWALAALSVASGASVGSDYAASVWDGLDEQLLAQAAGNAERLDALRGALREGSFVYFAELARPAQLAICVELRKVAKLLIARLDQRDQVLNATLAQRAWRLGLLVLLAVGIVGATFWARAALDERRDLALGKPWSASSKYVDGCISPAQQCPESTAFFFHTAEESNPWIEFDLGASRQVSRLEVENRKDCCGDRAAPLTIELSTDHESWQSVARRDVEFSVWDARFAPSQARWVRLRALKRTYLHLERVRIF